MVAENGFCEADENIDTVFRSSAQIVIDERPADPRPGAPEVFVYRVSFMAKAGVLSDSGFAPLPANMICTAGCAKFWYLWSYHNGIDTSLIPAVYLDDNGERVEIKPGYSDRTNQEVTVSALLDRLRVPKDCREFKDITKKDGPM